MNDDTLTAHYFLKKHAWKEIVARTPTHEPIHICEHCGLLVVYNYMGLKTRALVPVSKENLDKHFIGLRKVPRIKSILKQHRYVFGKFLGTIQHDGL